MPNQKLISRLFIDFFLARLEKFKDSQEDFKVEFELIVNKKSSFKNSYKNWKWWFDNLDEIRQAIKNETDSKQQFNANFSKIFLLLQTKVKEELELNFKNKHLKISNRKGSLEEIEQQISDLQLQIKNESDTEEKVKLKSRLEFISQLKQDRQQEFDLEQQISDLQLEIRNEMDAQKAKHLTEQLDASEKQLNIILQKNSSTFKQYFKKFILLGIEKNKSQSKHCNKLSQAFAKINKNLSPEKNLEKKIDLYLNEFKNNAFIDDIVLNGLSNILNNPLTCNVDEKKIETYNQGKFDFSLQIADYNYKIKETRGSITSKEFKKMKEDKNNEVIDIDWTPIENSLEQEIVGYLTGDIKDHNKKTKMMNALQKGKTIVLLIKSEKLINQEKLKQLLLTELSKRHNQNDFKIKDLSKSDRITASFNSENHKLSHPDLSDMTPIEKLDDINSVNEELAPSQSLNENAALDGEYPNADMPENSTAFTQS